jgi:hypothetical protein
MDQKISHKPLPCIDCIALPMCRTFINNISESDDRMIRYTRLLNKCSLLHDYVYCITLYRPERFCRAVDTIEDKSESKQHKQGVSE